MTGGGTAVVYEGIDLQSKSRVALKILSVKDGKTTMPIKGVKREIEYAVSVAHENVVKLVDFIIEEHRIVIVWELIDGSDLLDLLNARGGRLDETTAAFYFHQLLYGVMFIHAHGLCHRDLKPENCMVERATRRLKIIDFGLSKHQHSAVTLGVGTPDYMAPELLGRSDGNFAALHERQIGHYDARACDVWAMGVLLYLIVTGQYPFEDPRQPQNILATLQNIAAGKMRQFSCRLSNELMDLIKAMLTVDPKERITLQEIEKHPWMVLHAKTRKPSPNQQHGPELSEKNKSHDGGIVIAASCAAAELHAPNNCPASVDCTGSKEGAERGGTFTFPSIHLKKQNGQKTSSSPATPKIIATGASSAAVVSATTGSTTNPPSNKDGKESERNASTKEGQKKTTTVEAWFAGLCKSWFLQ